MQKEYNSWNLLKQKLDSKKRNRWTNLRDVWWVSLGENIGTEENGKGETFVRPVLILKVFGEASALVIPLTSSQKEGQFYFNVGKIGKEETESVAILSQLRIIDTKRCLIKIGKVSSEKFLEIKKAMQKILL